MIKLSNIVLPLEETDRLSQTVSDILQTPVSKITVVKQSVDARHKNNIKIVFSVLAETEADELRLVETLKNPDVTYIESCPEFVPDYGSAQLESRPVIAGFGPAGMFCGYILAKYGYNPIIIERGGDVDSRSRSVDLFCKTGKLDTESNIQFGEGGAGTFSDGKLTTRINDPLCGEVLRTFVKFGAPEEILYMAKPHIGTDILKKVVKNIRNEIIRLGGEVRFSAKLTDIEFDNKLRRISINGISENCGILVLAIGHSARDTFNMLYSRNIGMIPKSFSVGARIEHLQSRLDAARYGRFAGHPLLRHAEYQLSYKTGGRCAYTFCMCPGGTVVPAASEEGGVVTNGMSEYSRNGDNANSAIVVDVHPSDFGSHPLDGVRFQQMLEKRAYEAGGKNYFAPCQSVGSFLGKSDKKDVKPSYLPGVTPCDMTDILPSFVTDTMRAGIISFERKIPGFSDSGAILTGVETRTSSPVRIVRDENLCAASGIYPAGEGAGYAGGIVSAAVDGIKIAAKIISKYKPF